MVAVIDTGIVAHPDLDARVVGGFDFVSNPAGLAAPRTPDGPDTPFDTDGQPGGDANPAEPGGWGGVAPVRDSAWDGTHVAGVVAAERERASLRFALGAVVTRMDQVVKEMMDEANKMGMIEDAKEIAEMHAQEEKEEQDAKPR